MTQAVQTQQEVGAFTAAVAEELRAQMARKRVSGRELARRVHVSAQWMSQRTRGVVPMDTNDMEMLAAALGITLTELLADAAQRVTIASPDRPTNARNSERYSADSHGVVIPFPQVKPTAATARDTDERPALRHPHELSDAS